MKYDPSTERIHRPLNPRDRMWHAIIEDEQLIELRRNEVIKTVRRLWTADVFLPRFFGEECRFAAKKIPIVPGRQRVHKTESAAARVVM